MMKFAGIPRSLLPAPGGSRTPRPFAIAIDGIGTSGKSTLGAVLSEELDAELIHVDDYFLPFQKRTPERMTHQSMGNVEWERLEREILRKLGDPQAVSCRFDCTAGDCTEPKVRDLSGVVIIEGVSILRRELRKFFDLKLFIEISPEERLRRIALRDPEWKQKRWHSEWIPLEDAYFYSELPKNAADYVLSGMRFFNEVRKCPANGFSEHRY
ncbi:shikimate kinase [Marispirochaeta sp.]|uniref:uridine kinase family protein n=1 Tax=Marispirochaeta sp. TaxID=2038653 RepID=UPI0029C83191|nr:shikimate kinase [Marispirochaeta sp.]